jgi:predicted RNase H-like HicB family nuclease
MKYSVIIQYDNADKIYVAKVPELSGCMAHGSTMDDAVKEIQIAAQLQMETMAEMGLPLPAPLLHSNIDSFFLDAV